VRAGPRFTRPAAGTSRTSRPCTWPVAQLTAVLDTTRSEPGRPGAHRFHAFVMCNGPGRHYLVPLIVRSLRARITLSR
jgi:hypothetical protein